MAMTPEERKAYNRAYQQANRERLTLRKRQYILDHAEEAKEYRRNYYKKNRTRLLEGSKEWQKANPVKAKQYRKRTYENLGKEANNQRCRADYQKHKEKRAAYNRQYMRKYYQRNKIQMQMYYQLMQLARIDGE